jgi:DNA-binding IclR family transcriptional regulator
MPEGMVPAVWRAVQILDLLASRREPLSLAELTQQLGLPKSSVLALCNTLAQTALLRRGDRSTFELGPRPLDWARTYLESTDITKEFVRAWDELGQLQDEGVVLSVLDGSDTVYVACRNGVQPLGVTYRIGMRLPASCTASGKALLSTLPDAQLRQLYRGATLSRLTARSHAGIKSLLGDLQAVRSRGYAIDDEEVREGMTCIGAPIFDASGHNAVAAVAVSALKTRSAGQIESLAAAVTKLAALLSRRLGGRAPLLAGHSGA